MSAEPFPENPADASGSAGGTQFQQSGSIFQPNVPDIFPFQEMFDPFPFIFHASFPFGRRFRHSRRDQFTVCLKCAQGTRQVWQIFRRNSADFCLQQQFCRIPFLCRGKRSGKNTAAQFFTGHDRENSFNETAGALFQKKGGTPDQLFLHNAAVKCHTAQLCFASAAFYFRAERVQMIGRQNSRSQPSGEIMQTQTAMKLFFENSDCIQQNNLFHKKNSCLL